MRVHPRAFVVDRASVELSSFAMKLRQDNDLTYIEYLGILNAEAGRVLKYALREERHPGDPDQSADIE
jgi:hypothetical protein